MAEFAAVELKLNRLAERLLVNVAEDSLACFFAPLGLLPLHEARSKGRVPGRKRKITAEQQKEIVESVSSGRKTAAEIACLFKIHRATVSRIVSQAKAGV